MTSKSSLPMSTRTEKFKGACLDSGAQQSVIGKTQAKAYCTLTGTKMKLRPSMKAFRFGDGVFNSLGTIHIRIPTPDGSFLFLDIDVVQANVPMLVGLDILDRYYLVPDNVENLLVNKKANWKMPITRKFGHLYLEWDFSEVLYTKTELKERIFTSSTPVPPSFLISLAVQNLRTQLLRLESS